MVPFPHQLTGKDFLVQAGVSAMLGDEPRCGKTGCSLLAADELDLNDMLVVTTASGRPVWAKAIADWSPGRTAAIYTGGVVPKVDVVIVSWALLQRPAAMAPLLNRTWSVVIADEAHYAKSFSSRRTQSLYGTLIHDGVSLNAMRSISVRAHRLWCLTGTPLPHSPADMYSHLRALQPERLLANAKRGWPDVTRYNDFLFRYCVIKMKAISQWNKIPVVVGGRNERELHERIGDWMLRRTQAEVGIRPPIYEILPLAISSKQRRELEQDLDVTEILAAIDAGDTADLEMHLGPLRRLTGRIKAPAIVEWVKDEFDCGLDRIVIPYWHREVGQLLLEGLYDYRPTGIDGSTPLARRAANVEEFNHGKARVFLAQIEAAGEAIDLSGAAVMLFAESVFIPRQMRQMSQRITNINQKRQCFVKVGTLAGSIDEAVQGRLLMLWSVIRNVLS
jgi:SNF2 family DNA or RNA helicase